MHSTYYWGLFKIQRPVLPPCGPKTWDVKMLSFYYSLIQKCSLQIILSAYSNNSSDKFTWILAFYSSWYVSILECGYQHKKPRYWIINWISQHAIPLIHHGGFSTDLLKAENYGNFLLGTGSDQIVRKQLTGRQELVITALINQNIKLRTGIWFSQYCCIILLWKWQTEEDK